MKPIIYEQSVDVRFDDLDPYGHVNASKYIDYVVSSRWTFFLNKFKKTASELAKEGQVFPIGRFEVDYKRPINQTGPVVVSSFVENCGEKKLEVEFSIKSVDGETTFSSGKFIAVCLDSKTGRSAVITDEMKSYFFE